MKHQKWPKFKNIQKMIAEEFLHGEEQVVVLEKLDGSNLGLEIHPQEGLVAIHGRSSVLWSKTSQDKIDTSPSSDPLQDALDRKYGSVKGTLHPIATLIPKLQTLAEQLIDEEEAHAKERLVTPPDHSSSCHGVEVQSKRITFFGEWYKEKVPEVMHEPSWYPFGYTFTLLRHEETTVDGDQTAEEAHRASIPSSITVSTDEVQTMTSRLYHKIKACGIEPPPLLFEGTLCEAIDTLYPQLLEPPHVHFEGVFITFARTKEAETRKFVFGAKWKTGQFEEQSNFVLSPSVVSKLHASESLRSAIDQLEQVYETKFQKMEPKEKGKASVKKQRQPKVPTQDETSSEALLDRQIHLALHSVLSKSPCSVDEIREMEDRSRRVDEMQRIINETLQDVLDTLEDSKVDGDTTSENLDCNSDKIMKDMKKRVGRVVSKYIMTG